MSTAQTRHKSGQSQGSESPKGHPFRNALLISLGLAALVLWQLNPIIRGLHDIDVALLHAEGVRRVAAGLLSSGYHRLDTVIAPLVHHVGK